MKSEALMNLSIDAIDNLAYLSEKNKDDNIKAIKDLCLLVLQDRRMYINKIRSYSRDKPIADLFDLDYLSPLNGVFYERAHTMIISFLLNPSNCGNISNEFLKNILKNIPSDDVDKINTKILRDIQNCENLKIINTETEAKVSSSKTKYGSPDITVNARWDNKEIKIIFENKVYSSESDDQTPGYFRAIEKIKNKKKCEQCVEMDNDSDKCTFDTKNIYLYLTPKKKLAKCKQFFCIDYKCIEKAIKYIKFVREESQLYSFIVKPYLKTLQIMNEPENESKRDVWIRYGNVEKEKFLSLEDLNILNGLINKKRINKEGANR